MPAGARNLTLDTALADAEERYVARNPASRARHEVACARLPGGNTRSILHFSPFPLNIVHGEGARLRDADGHGYLDFLSEYTAGLYGHSYQPAELVTAGLGSPARSCRRARRC